MRSPHHHGNGSRISTDLNSEMIIAGWQELHYSRNHGHHVFANDALFARITFFDNGWATRNMKFPWRIVGIISTRHRSVLKLSFLNCKKFVSCDREFPWVGSKDWAAGCGGPQPNWIQSLLTELTRFVDGSLYSWLFFTASQDLCIVVLRFSAFG